MPHVQNVCAYAGFGFADGRRFSSRDHNGVYQLVRGERNSDQPEYGNRHGNSYSRYRAQHDEGSGHLFRPYIHCHWSAHPLLCPATGEHERGHSDTGLSGISYYDQRNLRSNPGPDVGVELQPNLYRGWDRGASRGRADQRHRDRPDLSQHPHANQRRRRNSGSSGRGPRTGNYNAYDGRFGLDPVGMAPSPSVTRLPESSASLSINLKESGQRGFGIRAWQNPWSDTADGLKAAVARMGSPHP